MEALAHLAESLCENFPALQAKGHPKWGELDLSSPELGRGWFYYSPTATQLRTCIRSMVAKAGHPRKRECTQTERILGLCG